MGKKDFAESRAWGHVARATAVPDGVQKRRATRQARNTMGSRQRLKVVGILPAASAPASIVAAPQAAAVTSPAVNGTNGTGTSGPNGQSH